MNARFFRAPALTAGAMLVIVPAVVLAALPLAGQEALTSGDGATEVAPLRSIAGDLAGLVGVSLGRPGGETRSIPAAPTDPPRLYVGSATGHIFRSDDGANTWRELPVNLGHEAVIDNLLVHPREAARVFAAYYTSDGTGGLVQTRDAGVTWAPLAVPGSPSLRAIAMAPGDMARLYVGGIGGVWRSDDDGVTWRNINGVGLPSNFIESLAVDPRDPDHVYAGTWRQVYRTRDGGETWTRIYQGMAIDRDIFSLTISPHDPDTVFAGTCNFLYRSNDGGGSWNERRTGLETTHNRVHVILHDPTDPERVFAGTRGALYKSTDGGLNWEMLVPAITVSGMTLDVERDRLYVATEERGILVGPTSGGLAESNSGLFTSRVVAFDVLPGAPRFLFAARADGTTSTSVHYSTDIGQTWKPLGVTPAIGEIVALRAQLEPINRVLVVSETSWWNAYPGGRWEPVPAPPGQTNAVEIAHNVNGAVFAATTAGLFVATAEALRGTEGAALPFDAEAPVVWRPIVDGTPVTALAVEGEHFLAHGPGGPTGGRVRDALEGRALRATPPRITDPVRGVALDPTNPRVGYAMTTTEIFRTDDGGASWVPLPLPWPAARLRSIAVDPARPEQILVLDYRGAIYRGHGDGEHWLILDEDPGLYRAWSLRASPQAPGFALVATLGHGLRAVSLDPLAETAAGGSE